MNEEFVFQVELEKQDVFLILQSLELKLERWAGGNPDEQHHLSYLITEFQRMALDALLNTSE